LDNPMIPSRFHPAGQGGISRWEQCLTLWCGVDFAIGETDGGWGGAGGDGVVAHFASLRIRLKMPIISWNGWE
jgi:hypothetical protein